MDVGVEGIVAGTFIIDIVVDLEIFSTSSVVEFGCFLPDLLSFFEGHGSHLEVIDDALGFTGGDEGAHAPVVGAV